MVVVVVDPGGDGFPTGLLGVVGPGIEAFLGKDPLITLDLPVVPGRVRPGTLMPRRQRGHGAGDALRAVVRVAVRDGPDNPRDPVGGEEHPGLVEEADGRCRGLVMRGLGVGEAGVAVDRGMQVRVADPLFVSPLGCEGLDVPAAVAHQPPPSGIWPTFFRSRCGMWPGTEQ